MNDIKLIEKIGFDPLSRIILGLILGGILAVYGFLYKKSFNTYLGSTVGFISFFYLILITNKGSAKIITNKYNKEIYIKKEQSSEIKKISPFKTSKIPLDGIATSYNKDKVYKVYNGIWVKIKKNGDITPISPISKIFNYIGAGWRDKKWFDKKDGENWNPLFEKVNELNINDQLSKLNKIKHPEPVS